MGKRRRRFQFCIGGSQSVRRLFLQLSNSRLAPARTPGRHAFTGWRPMRSPTSVARGLWGQTRWRNNGGLQTFLQTFPNLTCFSPSFSKESFGGFVEFQRVTRVPNPKSRFPNYSSRPPPVRPRSERRRATFHRLGCSDPGVFSGSSCCGTAGRTFRPSLRFRFSEYTHSTNSISEKVKRQSVVGQLEFSISNATGLARQECAQGVSS